MGGLTKQNVTTALKVAISSLLICPQAVKQSFVYSLGAAPGVIKLAFAKRALINIVLTVGRNLFGGTCFNL